MYIDLEITTKLIKSTYTTSLLICQDRTNSKHVFSAYLMYVCYENSNLKVACGLIAEKVKFCMKSSLPFGCKNCLWMFSFGYLKQMCSQSNGNLIELKLNAKYNSYRFLIFSFISLPFSIKVGYYHFGEWDHPKKSSGKILPKSLLLGH